MGGGLDSNTNNNNYYYLNNANSQFSCEISSASLLPLDNSPTTNPRTYYNPLRTNCS